MFNLRLETIQMYFLQCLFSVMRLCSLTPDALLAVLIHLTSISVAVLLQVC